MDECSARPCLPGELKALSEFLDLNFGYPAGESYAVDFAPLFESQSLENSRLVWKNGKIASSAILYPVQALLAGKALRLGIVGAVATLAEYRGQGLSTLVLQEIWRLARTMHVDGVILWSEQEEFYAKTGFSPAGRQQIFSLSNLEPPALCRGMAVYGWDWRRVRSLYERHALRIDRTDDYWRALQGVKSCTQVQWIDADGDVLAYLGFDRGRDMRGIVHEWGGDPTALHSLLWTVLQNRPELLWLTHPDLVDPIRQALAPETPLVSGALGLFKPLRDGVAAKDLEKAWFWGLDSL